MSTSAARRLRRQSRTTGRAPLPAVSAWLEANRSRFKAGELAEVVVIHAERCPYPGGGECVSQPEFQVRGEDPGSN